MSFFSNAPEASRRSVPPRPRELLRRRPGSAVLFAFDFDGTLTPIAPRPGGVILEPEMRTVLTRVAERVRLVICSGRALRDLAPHLEASNASHAMDLIGNHGLEWRISGVERDLTPASWAKWRSEALGPLEEKTSSRGGVIEDKEKSLTIHYRHSGTEWWSSNEARVWLESWSAGYARLIPGKAAWNILPPGICKGEALIRYAREFGFQRMVYFGDEPTDETVFVRDEVEIIGVKVGEGPTVARYRVQDSQEVRVWLEEILSVVHV